MIGSVNCGALNIRLAPNVETWELCLQNGRVMPSSLWFWRIKSL